MQWSAYGLQTGEMDAPQGLKVALANANREDAIFTTEGCAFADGRQKALLLIR